MPGIHGRETAMDVFRVEPDNTEQIVASDISQLEMHELLDWFRNVKPIGRDLKLVARPACEQTAVLSVSAAGSMASIQ
jgi:hypothetical protein